MCHLDPSSRLPTIDMSRMGALPPFGGGELGPHLAQCGLGWRLRACQVPSWSFQPFGTNWDVVCDVDSAGSKKPSIRWGPDLPMWRDNFEREGHPVVKYRDSLSWAVQQVLSSSWNGRPFGDNRYEPKIGGRGLCPFLVRKLDPHVTQCGLGRGLTSYQVASWSIQPFDHNKHGPKSGVWLCPF